MANRHHRRAPRDRHTPVATPADARQAQHPADALPVYWRVVDEVLTTADRRAYAEAIRILKRARAAATTAHRDQTFTDNLAAIREAHRRRPTLIAMLNKAGLG